MEYPNRCPWPKNDPLYISYHDEHWGKPVYDDNDLFAKLILDGFQAGLSWITILRKQENFYKAFDNFDANKMAKWSDKKIEKLMQNEGIIRNRLKINAAKTNAQAYLNIQEEGSFSDFLWSFTDGKVIKNKWKKIEQVPTSTVESDAMSKALKKAGFKFVGTTICYAFMQAVGIVNDHLTSCLCYNKYN